MFHCFMLIAVWEESNFPTFFIEVFFFMISVFFCYPLVPVWPPAPRLPDLQNLVVLVLDVGRFQDPRDVQGYS